MKSGKCKDVECPCMIMNPTDSFLLKCQEVQAICLTDKNLKYSLKMKDFFDTISLTSKSRGDLFLMDMNFKDSFDSSLIV